MKIRALLGFLLGAAPSANAAVQAFDELARASREYLDRQQEQLQTDFALMSHERWEIDQKKGELIFSNHDTPAIIAKFQFVGSFSSTASSWLWSWGNASVLPDLSRQVKTVRAYGKQHGFRKLTERKWQATEEDGWDMAAITNYLLKGKGVYRPPFEQVNIFLVITEIRRVEQ
jgi:hypothetical protein